MSGDFKWLVDVVLVVIGENKLFWLFFSGLYPCVFFPAAGEIFMETLANIKVSADLIPGSVS